MLTPDEIKLLNRLLQRAHPTAFQQQLISRLQEKLGVPVRPGEARQRVIDRGPPSRWPAGPIPGTGRAGAALPPVTPNQVFGLHYYRRLIEMQVNDRNHTIVGGVRYRTVTVSSPTPLTPSQLIDRFSRALHDVREYSHFGGDMRYIDPALIGRALPGYTPRISRADMGWEWGQLYFEDQDYDDSAWRFGDTP